MRHSQVKLINNSGFSWHSFGDTIHTKGYLFDKEGNIYHGQELLDYFKSSSLEELTVKINEAQGSYSYFVKIGDALIFGVDRLRCFPLFYTTEKGILKISETALELLDSDYEYSPLQGSAFLRSGHTLAANTLVKEIKQVELGQFIIYHKGILTISTYHDHRRPQANKITLQDAYSKLSTISNRITDRLIKFAKNRQIVIPLSGGYDSRYVLAMLVKNGYKNIFCYTYGLKTSEEVVTARKVIEQLKVEWHHVKYPMSWDEYYHDEAFQLFASQMSGLPNEQDYLAVNELKEKKLIDKDAIFAPGFSGDLLGGRIVPDFYHSGAVYKKDFLVEYIFTNQFAYENPISKQEITQIKSIIKEEINYNSLAEEISIDSFISLNETFFIQNYLAKFHLNSLRVYEYFGYQWYMPLWDQELVDYWIKVPNQFRSAKHLLYEDFLLKVLFQELNINYAKPPLIKTKTKIKSILGKKVMDLGRKVYVNSPFYTDFNNTKPLLRMYQKDLKKLNIEYRMTTKPNKIMAAWTLEFIKNKILTNFIK